MAKSSKLSDNLSTTSHIITELFHAENEKQSTKNNTEKEHNKNDKRDNGRNGKKSSLFNKEDYIVEIDNNFQRINKESFLKYLEDIINNIVEKSDYKDLSSFKEYNKKISKSISDINNIENKVVDDKQEENHNEENDRNLTGNLLDIDV